MYYAKAGVPLAIFPAIAILNFNASYSVCIWPKKGRKKEKDNRQRQMPFSLIGN